MAISPSTKLLVALDVALGVPNKLSSRISLYRQSIDPVTHERVYQVEYRVQMSATPDKPTGLKKPSDQQTMSLLKSLLDKTQ